VTRRGRELPIDPELEELVLNRLLLAPDAALDGLSASDFYDRRHSVVFGAIQRIRSRGAESDVVSVRADLEDDDLLGVAGGAEHLHELVNVVSSPGAYRQHVERLRVLAQQRHLIELADELSKAALTGDDERIRATVEAIIETDQPHRNIPESFEPVELAPVLAGNYRQPEPLILPRDDGSALFYPGQVNGIHGDSGLGKGWITCAAVADELRRGHRVMLIDLEDTAPSIVARLRLLGARDNEIAAGLIYVRPTAAFTALAVDGLCELIDEHTPRLVVLDSLGEAFGLDGIDENSDAEVGPWLRRVPRRLAELGPAVTLVDHSTKAADNPLHPSGSKRKRAAIGGASYLITATTPLVAGTGGRLKLVCAKDRHGTYRRDEHVADFVMTTDPAGTRWALYAPEDRSGGAFELPVYLAARAAVKVCQEAAEPLTSRRLVERMAIKTRRETKYAGIEEAVARGALHESAGANRARLFEYRCELPEALT
jgi:hypothetical protein